VGSARAGRELTRARAAYIASVARLNAAMDAFGAADVPLDPGPNHRSVPAWTPVHVQVVTEARDAWRQLVATRHAYDVLRRQLRPE